MANKQERVMIVCGEKSFADSLSAALKNNDYVPLASTTASNLIQRLIEETPDLLILDVTLPDADAYSLIESKSAAPLIAKIPVFLISTQSVPVNLNKIKAGSVLEIFMAFHSNVGDIVDKANRHFGHESVNEGEKGSINSEGSPRSSTENGSARKTKVLWVEDDKLIGAILAKKMIASGFDLFHAKSGEEAVEALKQTIPDVVVMDLLLPGISGFDVLVEMNKDEELKKVPVMVLSNLSKPSDIDRAKTLGAKRFLIKAATSLEQIVREVNALTNNKS